MGLLKFFILAIIPALLQGENAKKKADIATTTHSSLNSLWRPFDCRMDSDCPKLKYCFGWKCVLGQKGFCLNDSDCSAQEWCHIKHVCVKKSWCDANLECGLKKCCAKINPLAQGRCLPLIKPGQLCLIEAVLCPCVKGYYCKPFSKELGHCTKDQNIKI